MKINEIIREKRLAKGLTQEQAASRLGVSPPAVNKWEKGVTYPDITLLPALARLSVFMGRCRLCKTFFQELQSVPGCRISSKCTFISEVWT